jgi:glycine/sarcosine N-methyltransferase
VIPGADPDPPNDPMAEGYDRLAEGYDRLAGDYHRIFEDWPAAVRRQGEVLDRAIKRELGDRAVRVLDASSGIGTQAIALALAGHAVTATDLSGAAVRRAAGEARHLGAELRTQVADMRRLADAVEGTFDAVVSLDNSIAHLLTDEDLDAAAGSFATKLAPGGLVLVSLRDYRDALETHPPATTIMVHGKPRKRRLSFQVWEWLDDRTYRPTLVFMDERGAGWDVTSHRLGPLRAILPREVGTALASNGFRDVHVRQPEETGFYQPIISARR